MQRASVDLPQPVSPTRPSVSPRRTSRLDAVDGVAPAPAAAEQRIRTRPGKRLTTSSTPDEQHRPVRAHGAEASRATPRAGSSSAGSQHAETCPALDGRERRHLGAGSGRTRTGTADGTGSRPGAGSGSAAAPGSASAAPWPRARLGSACDQPARVRVVRRCGRPCGARRVPSPARRTSPSPRRRGPRARRGRA